jgi:hypothetical protein
MVKMIVGANGLKFYQVYNCFFKIEVENKIISYESVAQFIALENKCDV